MQAIKIDEEFRTLIPPLTDDEFQRLEKSILAEGVREPIITWNGTIIDGHNRYRICEKHGLDCPSSGRSFASRDAAKIWIIENQFGRRNLSNYQKVVLALALEPLYIARAKAKEYERETTLTNSAKSQLPTYNTRKEIAEAAGVSEDTIRKVKTIENEAANGNTAAIKARDALINGEKKSIHGAYIRVVGKDIPRTKKESTLKDGRRICAMCGEPINEGEAHSARPTVHKKCEQEYQRDWEKDKRSNQNVIAQRKYLDADRDLRENVPVFNTDSLFAELEASAEMLRDSWLSSIEINESMGVKLTKQNKNKLEQATKNLFDTINEIRKGE